MMSKKKFVVVTVIGCLILGGLYFLLNFLFDSGLLARLVAGAALLAAAIIGSVSNYKKYVS
jgi:hypothetical protein